jgi:hypothetical protein
MTSVLDTIKNIQTITSNYNNQISSLIKILQDETFDDSNKLTQEKISQIVYNTQIDIIDKIAQDYNINSRELTKKYVTKPKKEKKSRDNLLQMIDTVNSFDNLANLSNQNILANLTNTTQLNAQLNAQLNTQLNVQSNTQSNAKHNIQTNNLDFDNFVDIEESPTMKGIIKIKNTTFDNSNSDEEDDLVNLLIKNKKKSEELNDSHNITQLSQTTNVVAKKRGRRSKASMLENENDNSNLQNETETSQSFDIIYKSLTIKGKNYLLNLSTNEIFDMENILVGKKKGDKILFKKNIDVLDV